MTVDCEAMPLRSDQRAMFRLVSKDSEWRDIALEISQQPASLELQPPFEALQWIQTTMQNRLVCQSQSRREAMPSHNNQ
jgi:hypothetical protein